ncbi:MAG TPA: hypothetical protein VK797_03535 [Tepidisphaeraceae bacterium]|jgi:hypothetical protein|nr:hypothetical protein [Tepidisphaeraceae bacterium]
MRHRHDAWTNRIQTVLLPLSLALLVLLLCGYVGRIGFVIRRKAPGGAYHAVRVAADLGRVVCSFEKATAAPVTGIPAGISARSLTDILPPRAPDVRRSVWEFDAHQLTLVRGATVFLIGCPIWCVAAPCLIAPAIWLRRRRRDGEEQKGFPLDQ